MIKKKVDIVQAASEWFLFDGKRLGYNVTELVFEANSTSTEDSNSTTSTGVPACAR